MTKSELLAYVRKQADEVCSMPDNKIDNDTFFSCNHLKNGLRGADRRIVNTVLAANEELFIQSQCKHYGLDPVCDVPLPRDELWVFDIDMAIERKYGFSDVNNIADIRRRWVRLVVSELEKL